MFEIEQPSFTHLAEETVGNAFTAQSWDEISAKHRALAGVELAHPEYAGASVISASGNVALSGSF